MFSSLSSVSNQFTASCIKLKYTAESEVVKVHKKAILENSPKVSKQFYDGKSKDVRDNARLIMATYRPPCHSVVFGSHFTFSLSLLD